MRATVEGGSVDTVHFLVIACWHRRYRVSSPQFSFDSDLLVEEKHYHSDRLQI
jgi:hypothetical protein